MTLTMLGRLGAEGANYKAIEYTGTAVAAMEIDDRMTLSNHAAEPGAKAALLEADEKTIAWLDPDSEIWIGSAATVAASALTGQITDPREVAGGDWQPAKAA